MASLNCTGPECIPVTRAFIEEHHALFAENIRLKAALAVCAQRTD